MHGFRSMRKIGGIFLAGLLLACQGGSTTGGTETGNASESSIGAAVGSIFSSESDSAAFQSRRSIPLRLVALLVKEAQAEGEGSSSACDMSDEGPDGISISPTVAADTYGVSSDEVTVTAADGCDQGGTYASFTITSRSMDCTNNGEELIMTMTDSTGVFTEDAEANATRIYGTFNVAVGGGEPSADIRCSFTIPYSNEGGNQQLSGTCEDRNGNTIEQSSDTICEAN